MQAAYENLSKSQAVALLKEHAFTIEKLETEIKTLKRLIFGAKSERFVADTHPEQTALELGLELPENPQVKTEQIAYTRKKATQKPTPHGRGELPAHLPRNEIAIKPDEDTTGLKKIGEEITEELEYAPGTFYVNRYVRPKYAKSQDEGVIIGTLPRRPIEKGIAGPGLLAHVILSKCIDHLPLYRQRQQYLRQDIDMAVSTLSDWFAGSCRALEPLFALHRQRVLNANYLQIDETPIRVLDRTLKGKSHKGYIWAYYDPLGKGALFDYRKGRGREGPKALLADFTGTIQTDGYEVYEEFARHDGIVALACMAHARRYFEKALDSAPEPAKYVLLQMQKLYRVEREARELGLSHAERRDLRLEKARPVLDALEKWLKAQLVAPDLRPKSTLGKAISYALARWQKLVRYLDDGRYEIDNNLIENSIRPIALGRKNYLFAGSHEGARRLAMVYSFAATAKLHGIEPFAWLRDVLARIADHPHKQLAELLPPNWQPRKQDAPV